MSAAKKIVVTQVRSPIRNPGKHRRTLQALGLGRIGRSVEHQAGPAVLGMLRSVAHLVLIDEKR